MRSSDGFRDFALGQLSGVPRVTARAMFGGIGLYADDVFFGLIAADGLYLKTDDSNRADFEALGSAPFRPYPGRPMTMPYYNVPASILEDADALATWARRSVRIAVEMREPTRAARSGLPRRAAPATSPSRARAARRPSARRR